MTRREPRVVRVLEEGRTRGARSIRSAGHGHLDRMCNDITAQGKRINGVHVIVMYGETGYRSGFKANGSWDSWAEALGCLSAARDGLSREWSDGE